MSTVLLCPLRPLVVALPPFQLGLLVVDLRPFSVGTPRCRPSSGFRCGPSLSTFRRFPRSCWLSTSINFPSGLLVANRHASTAGLSTSPELLLGLLTCRPRGARLREFHGVKLNDGTLESSHTRERRPKCTELHTSTHERQVITCHVIMVQGWALGGPGQYAAGSDGGEHARRHTNVLCKTT